MEDAPPKRLQTEKPPSPVRTPASDPEEWLDLHGNVLFRYALSRVRTRDLAEELVQETFAAALQGRKQFSGRSSEQTWMIGILRRKIVDHIRRSSRNVPVKGSDVVEQFMSNTFDSRGHWQTRPTNWPADPAGTLEQHEFWDLFDKCVSRLPASVTASFCLRELEQLSGDEVCKVLGISASNLWTQLHRARMLLRKCLELNWFTRKG